MSQAVDTHADSEAPMGGEASSFADIGKEMWSFLTGRKAAINYEFVDLKIGVPRSTGAEAPRATWELNGTLRITTADERTS